MAIDTIKKFKDRADYKAFLEKEIIKLNNNQIYNIFMHMISNCGEKFSRGTIEYKKNSILINGLTNLSKYGSINATMYFIGSTDNINLDKIIDYNYDNIEDAVCCVIAIPKYIEVNGETLEYSTYKGKAGYRELYNESELIETFRIFNKGYCPDSDHFKCSFFDAIKQDSNLPMEYLFGIQEVNKNKNIYAFTPSNTHLSLVSEAKRKEHDEIVQGKINLLYRKYNTKKDSEIFARSSADYIKDYVNKSADYDFDFD